MINHFSNLSCCEEFEIQCSLIGISKIDVLKEIGYKIDDYYFFVSKDGIFNWFDLNGNHIDDPGVLKEIKDYYIPKTITKCVIPNSVLNIGNATFYGCESLKSISISDNVKHIGNAAFVACISLTSITIPNDVISIGNRAFFYCDLLTSINIPNNVTSIGFDAFDDCNSLKKVILP